MSDVRTIGILGGGQLGRMLSVAASRLGIRCHIYEPGTSPAADVAWRVTHAPYDDQDALQTFAESVERHHLRIRECPDFGIGSAGENLPSSS